MMELEIKTGKQLYQEIKSVDTKIEQELEGKLCTKQWVSVESLEKALSALNMSMKDLEDI